MKPKVSILLPIRNEERWLAQTLRSIQDQDFADFEVLISDNASTDKSVEIYTPIVRTDSRFKLFKHEHDIGAFTNFTFLLSKASADYIVFAGGHDIWSSNYIRVLMNKLDADKDIIITFGNTTYIDEHGRTLPKVRGLYSTEGVRSIVRRFNIYMWADQNPIYGMARRIEATNAFPKEKYVVGGQIYLQRMAIRGQFAYVPEVTFFRRENRPSEVSEERFERYSNILFKERINIRISFWKSVVAIVATAFREPILKGNRWRRLRLRFQLISTSLTSIIRFWQYLW